MSKYYVVKEGRQRGIFQEPWDQVKPLVDKYPGAVYKGFTTYDEALRYYTGHTAPPVAIQEPSRTGDEEAKVSRAMMKRLTGGDAIMCRPSASDGALLKTLSGGDTILCRSRLRVYTDGSYRDGTGGYGIVIARPDAPEKRCGPVPAPCTNQRAELYAILMALQMVTEESFDFYTDSKYSIGCCTEWLPRWKLSGWMTSTSKPVENRDLIEAIDKARGGRDIRFFHVKGHSGDTFNELCDQLANQGCTYI